MSQKAEATKLTEARELALVRLLNSGSLSAEDAAHFSCNAAALTGLRADLLARYPSFNRCVKVGGLGTHYDGKIFLKGGGGAADAAPALRYELKHSAKKLAPETLRFEPWGGGVQFRQNQFKAAAVQPFLDSAGLYRAWFETHVAAFVARHAATLALGAPLTYDDYFKISTGMKAPEAPGTTPAERLICALRERKALQEELQREWLAFEDAWLPAHPLELAGFTTYVKEIFEEKDLWINISRSGAFLLEGLVVLNVRSTGTQKKPRGGTLYSFLVRVATRSNLAETHEVPIQFKYTWKNGGQAVQNLNFLLVSGGAA